MYLHNFTNLSSLTINTREKIGPICNNSKQGQIKDVFEQNMCVSQRTNKLRDPFGLRSIKLSIFV